MHEKLLKLPGVWYALCKDWLGCPGSILGLEGLKRKCGQGYAKGDSVSSTFSPSKAGWWPLFSKVSTIGPSPPPASIRLALPLPSPASTYKDPWDDDTGPTQITQERLPLLGSTD